MNIPNSDELAFVMNARNALQLEAPHDLFDESGSKKGKFVPAGDGDEVAYVTISSPPLQGLVVKKAKKARDDLVIPLQPDHLKVLFDYLSQDGTSCLGSSKRSYAKTGKFSKTQCLANDSK